MAECISKIQERIWAVLELSGKGLEQIGIYPDCQQSENLTYNLVNFALINTTDPAANIGLCLPSECDNQAIKFGLDAVIKASPYPLYVLSVDNRVEDYFYEYDWVFYLTCLLTLSSIFLVVYSSLKKPKNKLSAFSVQETVKIFRSNPTSNLNVLNGVRSLAMMWVVLGHCMSSSVVQVINFQTVEKNVLLQPIYLVIEAGLFAVDVFFYVGGLLVAYVVLRDTTKTNLKYLLAIFQRFLRFWPSYLFTIMVFYSVYLHMGDGPLWGSDEATVLFCQRIWKPIFFIDNLVDNGETQCMGWGWYLQNDMQLFAFSMVLLLIYSLKPSACKGLIWLLTVLSLLFTFLYCMENGVRTFTHIDDLDEAFRNFQADVYIKPWARCPPYFFGLFCGILYHEHLSQIKQPSEVGVGLYGKVIRMCRRNKMVKLGLEWFGILLMFSLVAVPRTLQLDMEWSRFGHSLYLSVAKFAFVLGLHLTMLPSLLGCRESFVTTIMDTKLFNFIAKVSFCTYLIHLILISAWDSSIKTSRYYSFLDQFVVYCGMLVASLSCGTLMTFMIEAPFAKLQKSLIGWIKVRTNGGQQMEKSSEVHTTSSLNIKKSLLNS